MADRFVVWGAGGHGRVVADAITAAGHVIAAYVDDDPAAARGRPGIGGVEVFAAAELRALPNSSALPAHGSAVALGIGDNRSRLAAFASINPAEFPSIVHPRAVVAPSATLGPGTVVLAGAVVNAGARIGAACIVNTAAVVEHDCVIADAAHISPGAVLSGGVRVGAGAWIGAGAVIIQSITVGAWARIGAGAVVIRDVPDGRTAVGSPARLHETTPEHS